MHGRGPVDSEWIVAQSERGQIRFGGVYVIHIAVNRIPSRGRAGEAPAIWQRPVSPRIGRRLLETGAHGSTPKVPRNSVFARLSLVFGTRGGYKLLGC